MKPSNELFELIKSLTKSEKRFFKLSSSLQSGDKNYLRIFDAIDKQEVYDEDEIRKQFRKENFIKHLPSEKNHLYKLILKSLRAYYGESSVSSILKHELKNIEILYKKALYKECNKFLNRAKKMAVENEKFYYLFELLAWEKLLLEESYEAGIFSKDLDALIQEEQDTIEKLRNLAAYHVLYSKINYVFRSGGYVRSPLDKAVVEEISHHPLIVGKNTALSKRAATICYYIQGFCAAANVDKLTALAKFQKAKEILDRAPAIRNDLSLRYVRTLGNMLALEIDLGQLEVAADTIAYIEKVGMEEAFLSDDIQLTIFKTTSLGRLRILEKQGEFDKAFEIIDEIEHRLENSPGRINKEQELLFITTIALVCFGAQRYKESLHWLNRVLNDNEANLRQDIYSYARIFNLVVHYELGNFELLEYVIKSTTRYLNKRQRDFELELTILNFMKRLAKRTSGQSQESVLLEFKSELQKHFQNETDQIILEYFNFPAWVESKLKGTSFREACSRPVALRA